MALSDWDTYNVKITAIIAVDLSTQSFHDRRLIQPFANVIKSLIAQWIVTAFDADVVRILACTLVGTKDGIVAVDRCRNTCPNTLGVIAGFYQGLTARQGVVH